MQNLEMALMVIMSLGPYFAVALGLALLIALFLPWGVSKPEKWFYFYLLFISLVGIGGADAKDGSLTKQITWGLLYVLAPLSLHLSFFKAQAPSKSDTNYANAPATGWRSVSVPVMLLLLTCYVFLSVLWSPQSMVSLKRSVQFAAMTLIALLSAQVAIKQGSLARAMSPALAMFMLLGVVFSAAAPGTAFSDEGLRAYTSHKNSWGQFCLLCAIIFSSNFLSGNKRLIHAFLVSITLGMLVLSRSATSISAAFVGIGTLVVLYSFHTNSSASKVILLLMVCSIAISILGFTIVVGDLPFDSLNNWLYTAMDRSSTLTGRTELWSLIWNEIKIHPWLGLGYGSFWIGKEGPSGYIAHMVTWGPPNQAHSGYLDTLNELGIVGLTLTVGMLLVHAYRCFQLYKLKDLHSSAQHTALLISLIMLNYAESAMQLGTNLWFVVLIMSIVETHVRVKNLQSRANQSNQTSQDQRLEGHRKNHLSTHSKNNWSTQP